LTGGPLPLTPELLLRGDHRPCKRPPLRSGPARDRASTATETAATEICEGSGAIFWSYVIHRSTSEQSHFPVGICANVVDGRGEYSRSYGHAECPQPRTCRLAEPLGRVVPRTVSIGWAGTPGTGRPVWFMANKAHLRGSLLGCLEAV